MSASSVPERSTMSFPSPSVDHLANAAQVEIEIDVVVARQRRHADFDQVEPTVIGTPLVVITVAVEVTASLPGVPTIWSTSSSGASALPLTVKDVSKPTNCVGPHAEQVGAKKVFERDRVEVHVVDRLAVVDLHAVAEDRPGVDVPDVVGQVVVDRQVVGIAGIAEQ